MGTTFLGQPYRDTNNPNIHRGQVAGIGVIDVILGIGHNNFTVEGLLVQSGLAATVNAGTYLTWDYHPTIKGAFRISVWKPTAAATTTLIAATVSVPVSFVVIAGASVIGG